jgi:adenosine/AMP kinase
MSREKFILSRKQLGEVIEKNPGVSGTKLNIAVLSKQVDNVLEVLSTNTVKQRLYIRFCEALGYKVPKPGEEDDSWESACDAVNTVISIISGETDIILLPLPIPDIVKEVQDE